MVAHGSQLPTASPHDQLYTVVACLLNVLQLSQFKPMLLPAYLRDIFAALVYERHVSKGPHSLAAQTLLDALMDDLPLRVTMSSVRAVLGQSHRVAQYAPPFLHIFSTPHRDIYRLRCGIQDPVWPPSHGVCAQARWSALDRRSAFEHGRRW